MTAAAGRPRARRREMAAGLLALGLAVLGGCALLRVAPLERASLLVPQTRQRPGYASGTGSVVTYQTEGLEVAVEAMSDAELNRLFPHESSLGEYSINPYTFGDWVDPKAGYVPNRFTVFRVTVTNLGLAKVELDPLRAQLTTNRPGEALSAYGILAGAARRTFEGYYRARRRPSGNEYYRFSMRMGIVRSNNYAVEKKIFKGESYGGYIVFDPLADKVSRARLTLRDFVLKFNAFDVPLERADLVFDFDRDLLEGGVASLAVAVAQPWSTARQRSPSQVTGNATGDASREQGFIDARVGEALPRINDCFGAEYAAGRAAEGQLDVRFAVGADGGVVSVEVTRSTVVSPAVGECVGRVVAGSTFGPSAIPVELLSARADAGAAVAVVTVTAYLEFVDVRDVR